MNGIDALGAALAGRNQMERELGQGGMATVFLARDLKLQIRTTAALQHPHILPVHDSGPAVEH